MEIKRLQILADFLPTVQADKFNIGTWLNAHAQEHELLIANRVGEPFQVKRFYSQGHVDINEAREVDTVPIIHTCGTTACAVGWATTLPALHEAGLKMGIYTDGWPYPGPVFENQEGIDAIMAFFGLSREEAEWLFLPFNYDWRGLREVTPNDVANRIQALINNPDMELDRAF